MEAFANPFTQILFVLTLVVISLSVISIRIQKANKLQKKSFEQSQVRTDTDYSSIGAYFQGDRTLVKCPSCAELISIEAKICKACRTNVEKYVEEVQSKLTLLEKENLKMKTKQKDENIKQLKIVGVIGMGLVLLFLMATVIGPIIRSYNETRQSTNATNYWIKVWKESFAECGFDEREIIVDKNRSMTPSGFNFFFEDKWVSDSEKQAKECLTKTLNKQYLLFNREQKLKDLNDIANWSYGSTKSDWDNNKDLDKESVYVVGHWFPYER